MWVRGATPEEAAQIASLDLRVADLRKHRAILTNRIAQRVRWRERHAAAARTINQRLFTEKEL